MPRPDMELLVYKASAGSGKTFTLAVEYISRLVLDPLAYREILAVTFTNKATAEMKERILQQLYGIWKGMPESEACLGSIRENLAGQGHLLSREDVQARCGTALLNVLHDYSRFRVETIDSFFQSVMRNLARELELSPTLNIELDKNTVLGDAVDSMIKKLTPGSPILAWLMEYIGERIADDKRWNVAGELKAFGQNIFDESYMERGGLLREKMRDPEAVKLYRNLLRGTEAKALATMAGFARRFEEGLQEYGLAADELKGGSKGIGSYFNKLATGKLKDKDVLNNTLNACLADEQNWVSRTSALKDTIITAARQTLMPLLNEAENARPMCNKTLNSCRLSLQHLNQLQLLNHIDDEVRTLNREKNRFLLADTNALLHRLVGQDDSSFVFEKLGATLRTVMIDEFQDTSRMQWDNFRLLLAEGLSQGADSLIVGDVKQSIYRWRNGDWRILNDLEEKQPGNRFPVRIKTLKTNRRSESNIVCFNNHFFVSAVECLNGKHQQDLGQECLPLKNAYRDVEQESPRKENAGYVQATFLAADDEQTYPEATLSALGEKALQLLQQGIRPNDIAILVRKNKNIFAIANYFEKELHLPIVSDEAFRLDASLSLCLLMDALRYIANPNDKMTYAMLVMNYHEVQQKETDWNALRPDLPPASLPAGFTGHIQELIMLPLYELLERIYGIFDLENVQGQDAYVLSFFDAVVEYLQNNPSNLNDFIRHWDETLCAKTIPGGEPNGIRIFSIHKSKGLEFHTVLIPFCDWKLENETNKQLVWCAPAQPPYNQLDLVPVTYSSTMAESVFREAYLQERMQLWVDNLNLLYVAFTRARSNLILWSKERQSGTIAELLAYALPQMAAAGIGKWDENTFSFGSLMPGGNGKAGNGKTPVNIHVCNMNHPIEFRQSNRSAAFIAGTDTAGINGRQSYIDRGRLLHTLFSAINTEADVEPAISRLVSEGVIARKEAEDEIRQLTRRALSQPQVKDWYSGSWRIVSEGNIIWRERGKLCKRRPDRVMAKDGELVVVDFKFGMPRESYTIQVKEYMNLFAQMDYDKSHISGYLWYVDQQQIEQVAF